MGNVTKIKMVKVHYLGDFEEPFVFVGVATKAPYKFGGRINLGEVDARDLTIGRSTHPGLLELTDDKGQKLFELWTPLKERLAKEQEKELVTEARARTKQKKDAPVIVEEPGSGEGTLPGD